MLGNHLFKKALTPTPFTDMPASSPGLKPGPRPAGALGLGRGGRGGEEKMEGDARGQRSGPDPGQILVLIPGLSRAYPGLIQGLSRDQGQGRY